MAKKQSAKGKRRRVRQIVLRLPELDQPKSATGSESSHRAEP
jgi:hypothetical protein